MKRELRSLTEADREKFLDAAAALWQYSDEEGRALFGDGFTSAATFVEEHALASNDMMCDQFHEGSGFLTHHLAITNSFEASLRAVNPTVTLPYWDFTIEGQQIVDEGESPSYFLEISPFLSDTWFGSVDEFDHIADSRFSGSTAPKVSNSSVVAPNSYGYIRSYWNNNNDERVVRHLFDVCGVEATHKTVPACKAHWEVLNTASLGDFLLLSPSDGHGPLHVQLGGIGGDCIDAYKAFGDRWSYILDANITESEILDAGYDLDSWNWGMVAPRRAMVERYIYGEYFHIYRSLWRSHMCARDQTPQLLVCPESCSADTPMADCACGVPALTNGTTDWENVFDCFLAVPSQQLFRSVMPDELLSDLVTTISSSPIMEGEMVESASPSDILFWVIHPTIERLLSAKRLSTVSSMGSEEFVKWNSSDGSEEEWLSYSYYSLEAGENAYFPDEYTCTGHAADDPVLPDRLGYISGFVELADTNSDRYISNLEYFLAMNPNSADGMDYVFDHFEWTHCD